MRPRVRIEGSLSLRRLAFAAITAVACASPPKAAVTGMPPLDGPRRSQSGVTFVESSVGQGAPVAARRCVYAHYTGWLDDGRRFESSHDPSPDGRPSEPVAFVQGAKKVMTGWEIGFDGMRAGGKRRLFIPYQLGYGASGNPPVIPPRTALVFDVEVMAVTDVPRSGDCPAWSALPR